MTPQIHEALESAGTSAMIAFGAQSQIIKCVEEMAELTKCLAKNVNGPNQTGAPVTAEEIIDEIADVFIMVHRMRVIFGAAEVDARITYKLNRTMEFIRNRERPSESESV